MSDERSLADVAADTEIVDTSVEPVPADFDLDSWLDGVRPTRRSVKLFPQAHLVARLEEIADRIDNTPDGVPVDDLIDEFEQIKAQFKAGVWFTVEKRSSEWEKKFRKNLCKQHKLDPDKDDDQVTIQLFQLAEQIVSPEGVTFNHLRKLLDSNEGELTKLLAAMIAANQTLADKAGVLDRDFSERRSDSDRG